MSCNDGSKSVMAESVAASGISHTPTRPCEAIAASSLQLAQTRLAAGVADPLDELRLQDDLARAQRTRVEAERGLALARLELRRLDGTPW